MPKMEKLLSIVGGKIIFRDDQKDFIHLVIEKTPVKKENGP